MKELTPMELLDRLEWRRQLRNIMGRISHDYAVKQEAKIYDRYFSRRDDVCLGLNNGYYKGAEAIKGYYDALDQEIRLGSQLLQKMFPEELGGKSAEEAYGVGMISYVPVESQVIEIADDGESAKGLWNVRGSTCHLTSRGPIAKWIFGWAAVDFVREDGEWKILNLLLVFNIDHPCGVAFTEAEKEFPEVAELQEIKSFQMPEPNVKETVFETYRTDRPATKGPRVPEPYETFAETFHYGI